MSLIINVQMEVIVNEGWRKLGKRREGNYSYQVIEFPILRKLHLLYVVF